MVNDKLKHFIITVLLFILVFLILQNYLISVVVTLLIGILKEAIDQLRNKNTIRESFQDILFNILGIIVAFLVIIIIF